MTDLAAFLLARIAEDEESVRRGEHATAAVAEHRAGAAVPDAKYRVAEASGRIVVGAGPARIRAECEAKRRLVGYWARADDDWAAGSPMVGYRAAIRDVLLALALPYADHPDYDEAWRP